MVRNSFFSACFFILSVAACAGDIAMETIDPWVALAPPGATVMAGYMQIKNNTKQDDTLLSVSCPDFAAVEVHESYLKDGMARMREVKQLTIPAGTSRALQPGGYHLMSMQPKKALVEGAPVVFTLVFAKAGTLRVQAAVKKAPAGEEHHHSHD